MNIRNDNIPFYSNTEDNINCFEACIRIIFKHFEPTQDWTWAEIEAFTGKRDGYWTWPTLSLLRFHELGYDVVLFEDFDYAKFTQEPVSFLESKYGVEGASAQIKNSNLPYEVEVAKKYIQAIPNQPRVPNFSDIHKLLQQEYLVICMLNSKALKHETGYIGHSVVVHGLDAEQIFFHDPGPPSIPNRAVSQVDFDLAWAYPDLNARNLIGLRKLSVFLS